MCIRDRWSSWSIYERSSNNPIIMACVRILGRRQAPNPCNHGLTIASPWVNLIKPHWIPNIAYLDPIGQHDEWNNISQEKPSPTTRFLWFGNIEWNDFCFKECSPTQTKIYPNHNNHGNLCLWFSCSIINRSNNNPIIIACVRILWGGEAPTLATMV